MELVKLFPVHQYSVDIFHILVFQEYCALMESRIPFGPGLWAWWLLRIPLVLTNRIYKNESAVFLYCRFSLFPDYLCSYN